MLELGPSLCGFCNLLRRAFGAPSSSNAERKEFRRSRLFKVTGRLIGMLMIDEAGEGRGLIFCLWFSWGHG